MRQRWRDIQGYRVEEEGRGRQMMCKIHERVRRPEGRGRGNNNNDLLQGLEMGTSIVREG